jgi:zinc transport system substrate-binding protein
LVNTTARFKDQYLPLKNVITHSHGAGGEHAHGDLAFTTWIDLKLATGQAGAVAAALSRKKPALKTVFQKNYAELKKDLLNLDQQIAEMATSDTGKLLVGSHPVYDYLAQRYGLNIKSVHWEPGEMQGAAQWKELETLLKEHPANWMIWEGEPLVETVGKLKARGLESVVFNPCGNIPEQGDFLSVMRRNVKNLQRVF